MQLWTLVHLSLIHICSTAVLTSFLHSMYFHLNLNFTKCPLRWWLFLTHPTIITIQYFDCQPPVFRHTKLSECVNILQIEGSIGYYKHYKYPSNILFYSSKTQGQEPEIAHCQFSSPCSKFYCHVYESRWFSAQQRKVTTHQNLDLHFSEQDLSLIHI